VGGTIMDERRRFWLWWILPLLLTLYELFRFIRLASTVDSVMQYLSGETGQIGKGAWAVVSYLGFFFNYYWPPALAWIIAVVIHLIGKRRSKLTS